jgi:poly-gamma-glutamate capsule biosynthesis protein CapA/YwtB (metallophosphatase superfamily)
VAIITSLVQGVARPEPITPAVGRPDSDWYCRAATDEIRRAPGGGEMSRAVLRSAATLIWLAAIPRGSLGAQARTDSPDPSISIALTGDAIITRPLSTHAEPAFLQLIALIRAQDAAFTNLEISLNDYETYPMVESGGLHLRAAPAMARELVWAGFDLAGLANNHATDWGVDGMRLTRRYAEEAGLATAGVGESLPAARAPRFLDLPKGRVALIASASTFPTNARAGRSDGAIPARPGLNPVRFTSTNVLTKPGMTALRRLAADLGQTLPPRDTVTFLGETFVVGDRPGRHTTPDERDEAEIGATVAAARGLSDLTIVSIHAHEGAATRAVPAEFLVTLAHAMVDAGADVFVGHGPHLLRGIEIYKGRPIFYSLGDFIFENETVERLPLDDFENVGADPATGVAGLNDVRYDHDRRGFPATPDVWESVVAVPRWRGRTLESITLYPITLGYGMARTRRGRPMLADDPTGRKIIADLQRLSEPFGTTIDYRAGIGVVRLDSTGTRRP